eukprot:61269-Rhodomonas_salina.7
MTPDHQSSRRARRPQADAACAAHGRGNFSCRCNAGFERGGEAHNRGAGADTGPEGRGDAGGAGTAGTAGTAGEGGCRACAEGTFKEDEGAHACTPCGSCPAGEQRESCSGAVRGNCTPCAAGSSKQGGGVHRCSPCAGCPAGQYRARCGAHDPVCAYVYAHSHARTETGVWRGTRGLVPRVRRPRTNTRQGPRRVAAVRWSGASGRGCTGRDAAAQTKGCVWSAYLAAVTQASLASAMRRASGAAGSVPTGRSSPVLAQRRVWSASAARPAQSGKSVAERRAEGVWHASQGRSSCRADRGRATCVRAAEPDQCVPDAHPSPPGSARAVRSASTRQQPGLQRVKSARRVRLAWSGWGAGGARLGRVKRVGQEGSRKRVGLQSASAVLAVRAGCSGQDAKTLIQVPNPDHGAESQTWFNGV